MNEGKQITSEAYFLFYAGISKMDCPPCTNPGRLARSIVSPACKYEHTADTPTSEISRKEQLLRSPQACPDYSEAWELLKSTPYVILMERL